MPILSKHPAYFFAFLALVVSGFAQESNPREQFQKAVAAYQKTPTHETGLKVIELYKQLDPPPAVPEETRRPFVMAVTVLKKANDKAGAEKAAGLFSEAIKAAPWFAEAYYNRALAWEITGQFAEAIDDLKLYLAFTLSQAERREAQDKIYSLEADAHLLADKNPPKDPIANLIDSIHAGERVAPQAQARVYKNLDGGIWRLTDPPRDEDWFIEIRGRVLERYHVLLPGGKDAKLNPQLVNVRQTFWKTPFDQLEFALNQSIMATYGSDATEGKVTISEDGQSITVAISGRYPSRLVYRRIR